jgi:hypothetical protein
MSAIYMSAILILVIILSTTIITQTFDIPPSINQRRSQVRLSRLTPTTHTHNQGFALQAKKGGLKGSQKKGSQKKNKSHTSQAKGFGSTSNPPTNPPTTPPPLNPTPPPPTQQLDSFGLPPPSYESIFPKPSAPIVFPSSPTWPPNKLPSEITDLATPTYLTSKGSPWSDPKTTVLCEVRLDNNVIHCNALLLE